MITQVQINFLKFLQIFQVLKKYLLKYGALAVAELAMFVERRAAAVPEVPTPLPRVSPPTVRLASRVVAASGEAPKLLLPPASPCTSQAANTAAPAGAAKADHDMHAASTADLNAARSRWPLAGSGRSMNMDMTVFFRAARAPPDDGARGANGDRELAGLT